MAMALSDRADEKVQGRDTPKEFKPQGGKIPSGWKRAENQGFNNFDEADVFLRDYCGTCIKAQYKGKRKCPLKRELGRAMGDNYPIWLRGFVKIEKKEGSYTSTFEDEDLFLVGCRDRVHCREYVPR